jgi:hypothetical protein
MDKGQVCELLGSISSFLEKNMKIHIGVVTENVCSADGPKEPISHIVLVGASNLKRTACLFEAKGLKVTDLCIPGWVATPENIDQMKNLISELKPGGGSVVVMDLFSNSTTRYIDYDGTPAKPCKMEGGGGYHLPGKICTCGPEVLRKIVEIAEPVLRSVPGVLKIILPPAPRYLFSGCCENPRHCTNLRDEKHAEKTLGDTMALRLVLKKNLVSKNLGSMWIVDTCYMVGGVDNASVPERVRYLREVCAMDGVHFSVKGYHNVCENVLKCIADLHTGQIGKPSVRQVSAAVSIAGTSGASASGGARHHWHGFTSPVGSRKYKQPGLYKRSDRDRYHRNFAPYGRPGFVKTSKK